MRKYLYNVGMASSCLANTLIGGNPEHSLSGTLGASILRGGVVSKIPMPAALKGHFVDTAIRNGRK